MTKTYETYKDSGIAWIGEIPSEWEVVRYKNICSIQSGCPFDSSKFSNTEGFPLLRIRDITSGKIETYYTGEYSDEFVVQEGDLLVGMDGDFNVRLWKNNKALLNQRCCRILENVGTNREYIFYSLPMHLQLINDLAYATTVKHLSVTDIYDCHVPLPHLYEQQSIASFLDKKCGEIDSLISLQEEMINELQAYKQSVITEAVTKGLNPNAPMKDSGVEWIGEIPEGWNVKRIKFVAEVWGRIGFRGYKSEDLNKEGIGAITLSPSNMKTTNMDYTDVTYLSWEKYNESPEIMVRNGDILYVKTGSSYGKACYVENLPREATINPQILRIVPSINAKYLCYFMQTSSIKYETECGVVGGTIPTISQEKINNMFVPCPPLSEQQAIASYLDEKTAQIDSLIALKQEKIQELKDYKKSIIYEYVTGKKRVI